MRFIVVARSQICDIFKEGIIVLQTFLKYIASEGVSQHNGFLWKSYEFYFKHLLMLFQKEVCRHPREGQRAHPVEGWESRTTPLAEPASCTAGHRDLSRMRTVYQTLIPI